MKMKTYVFFVFSWFSVQWFHLSSNRTFVMFSVTVCTTQNVLITLSKVKRWKHLPVIVVSLEESAMNSVNWFAIRKRERFVVMNHHLSPSILVAQAPARVLAPGQGGQCAQSAVGEVHRQKQGLMGRSWNKDAVLILAQIPNPISAQMPQIQVKYIECKIVGVRKNPSDKIACIFCNHRFALA